jgi:hypothetical protein
MGVEATEFAQLEGGKGVITLQNSIINSFFLQSLFLFVPSLSFLLSMSVPFQGEHLLSVRLALSAY